MPRTARTIDTLPEEILEAAAAEFMKCALAAINGQVPNQRELADRLGWPETTLSSALQGRFTFRTWPKICRALGRDPIDELVRGRDELRKAEDQDRAEAYRRMLERAEADTMVALWRKLPPAEQSRVLEFLTSSTPMAPED
jgi:hypothetical protein